MTVLSGEEALEVIRAQMAESRSATLAVAFWGAGAIESLGIDTRDRPLKIICNLAQGGTNPEVVRALRKLLHVGPKNVLQNDRLHAKVYLFDKVAVVGSSNASTNGLGFEEGNRSGWQEANVLVEDPGDLAALRDMVEGFKGSRITEADLDSAQNLWDARAATNRALAARRKSLLQELAQNPSLFIYRKDFGKIHVVLYAEKLDAVGEAVEQDVQETLGPDFSIFENWPGLPREKPLVCFWVDESSGAASFDGLWEAAGKDNDRGNRRYQTCQRLSSVEGYVVREKAGDRRWQAVCDWITRTRRHWRSGDGTAIPLKTIAQAIQAGKLKLPHGA
jgi:hypothetical protein